MFKKLLFIFFSLSINQPVLANNFKLEKLINLSQPWSLTFINEKEILISEKSGSLILYNKKTQKKYSIPHNLKFNDNGPIETGLFLCFPHRSPPLSSSLLPNKRLSATNHQPCGRGFESCRIVRSG